MTDHAHDHAPSIFARQPVLTGIAVGIGSLAPHFFLPPAASLGFAAVLIGLSHTAEKLFDPTFQGLRAIPSLAWVPLLLLWLGIDETSKVTMIAIGAFFPVYLALIAGIRNVDRKLIEVGEMYGFGTWDLARRIYMPAATPNLFTGLRTGLSVAWMFLVAAELLAATKGVGYLLMVGRETSRPDIVLAAILVLAIMGKLSDSILKFFETRALKWRDSLESRFQ